jgi:hypothetical protein
VQERKRMNRRKKVSKKEQIACMTTLYTTTYVSQNTSDGQLPPKNFTDSLKMK